ncbi:uncharacterized protein TNCV_2166441 [Trichonephila clavipes]|nr:uncharacterized protein TNCV_2166441 [Trichonephila clavipes]
MWVHPQFIALSGDKVVFLRGQWFFRAQRLENISLPFSLHAEIVEVEIEVVSPSIVPSGNFAELNRTVTCMVLKANDRRTSCPCHDEFRGPRSDYVRQSEKPEDSIAGASSSTTDTQLTSGRTVHSVLILPWNIAHEDSPICNFNKNSSRGRMLRQSKLLKEDFLSRNESSCAVEQFHSDASLKAVDRRVPNNSKNWQWKVRKAVGNTLVYYYRCNNVGLVYSSTSAAPWIAYESRFNLWDHDGRIRVRRYADERCLPECIIELNSGITPKVIVWGAISYDGRSDFLRIKVNINSSRYVHEVLQPEVIPFPQGISGAIFQQDIALPHVAKTVRDFCSAQNMQLLP